MTTQQPEALRLAEMLTADEWPGSVTLVSYAQECVAELRRQHARITELESQLAQRFDAADMATAAAQWFRDGATAPAQPVAAPATRQGGAYAELPAPNYPKSGGFPGTFAEAQMRAFADATHAMRAPHGQATAAQAVVQDDLITIRKPTTSAEMLWLLKLAHLVISDVDKTLEETFAPTQPAAQQGAAYAALPEKYYLAGGEVPTWDAKQLHAFADATHTLRASHGQAPSQAGEYPALVCDYCGALTPDPWHSSGMLHGKMSKHIHSCDACAARGVAKAQAAKQQEQLI